jgi:hypothetical protein
VNAACRRRRCATSLLFGLGRSSSNSRRRRRGPSGIAPSVATRLRPEFPYTVRTARLISSATRLKFANLRQNATVEDLIQRRRAVSTRHCCQARNRRPDRTATGPLCHRQNRARFICALGHKACRDDRSVLYYRVPRLLPGWHGVKPCPSREHDNVFGVRCRHGSHGSYPR